MRGALEGCDGVKSVEIDFAGQTATVVAKANLDPQKLVQAVKTAGEDNGTDYKPSLVN